ncbi:MAG: aldo/keto reductase [Acidimicrobiia bacterium]|nr:aldo/keto reductase [Acidimicrobiia bacterium]
MQIVRLTGTDLDVSRLCFGVMTFGGQTGGEEAGKILGKCLDAGINFLDTANNYNAGASEEMLARLIEGKRQGLVVASKVRNQMEGYGGLSRAAIFRAVEESLRRLKTDYLDLYYLHQPDYEVPIEETLAAMEELVRQGKVRYPATSNYASWQVTEMRWLAEKNGWKPVTAAQMMYNLTARGIEQEFLPMAKQLGVPVVVYNPLAGGLLTGKQKREAPIAGTRFDGNQMYLNRYWHDAYFDAVEALEAAAMEARRSMVSLSLSWLLHHTAADVVILGASKLAHLEENLRAAGEGPLGEATLQRCEEVWGQLRGVAPKYNR